MRDIPVYIFTGFLDSGKTTFIQETLAAPDFDEGGKTLLLVCEEGEVEYEPSKFATDVVVEVLNDESELTEENLNAINDRNYYDRVMVEYNGMWMLRDFFAMMPQEWVIAQEMCFMDATTFMMYNTNMRQLCFDKMQTAELLVFNRCEKGFDKMAFHKEVRIANRNSQIIYEYGPTDIELDDIADPLPYDMTKQEITISDAWYAEWYRDINDNQDDYEGKIFTIKGRVALSEELPEGKFAFGRHIMTCCAEDIQFGGLVAVYKGNNPFKTGDWVRITAQVKVEYEEAYGEVGPVLYCYTVAPSVPAIPELATF